MTYFNPVLPYGVDAFRPRPGRRRRLGSDHPGPDPGRGRRLAGGLRTRTSSTRSSWSRRRPSDERIALTAAATSGFLYAASTMGVTGARDQVSAPAPELVRPLPGASPTCRSASGSASAPASRPREIAGFADARDRRVGVRQRGRARRAGRGPRELAAELAAGIRCAAAAVRRSTVRDQLATVLGLTSPVPPRASGTSGRSPLRAYAICIIVGIVVAVWWGNKRFVARGGRPGGSPTSRCSRCRSASSAAGIYHVITDNQLYFGEGQNPWNALAIWNGGLGHLGGGRLRRASAPGSAAGTTGCRCRASPTRWRPASCVAQAIGRLGNYFNQELFGAATDLPWGLEVFVRVESPAFAGPGLRVPTANRNGVLCAIVPADVPLRDPVELPGRGRAGRRRPAVPSWAAAGLFAVYVAGYAGPDLDRDAAHRPRQPHLGLRINVFTSVIVFLGRRSVPDPAPKRPRGPGGGLSPGRPGPMRNPDRARIRSTATSRRPTGGRRAGTRWTEIRRPWYRQAETVIGQCWAIDRPETARSCRP